MGIYATGTMNKIVKIKHVQDRKKLFLMGFHMKFYGLYRCDKKHSLCTVYF